MRSLIIKTRSVDRVHAEHFHATRLDKIPQRPDHPLILKLPLVPRARQKPDQRLAIMPIHHHTHVPANPGRIPPVIFPLHASPNVAKTQRPRAGAKVCQPTPSPSTCVRAPRRTWMPQSDFVRFSLNALTPHANLLL